MKEEFIFYLWKHRLLNPACLQTINNERLEIMYPGQENPDSGPDFLSAKIRIGETTWVGNVEIHTRSSLWYRHGHHLDPAYDNIILHVVYELDKEICNSKNEPIPHLEIKDYFDHTLLKNYRLLKQSMNWIPCEKMITEVEPFLLEHWLCRLLICRLERKANEIHQYLTYFENHWELLFLFMFCRSLGGKANASAFGLLIQRVPLNVLSRNHDKPTTMESLLFGQAGLLDASFDEEYPNSLKQEYAYLGKKYDLPDPLRKDLWKYARMRPANFPDIRIAQLAMILHRGEGQLFQKMLETNEKKVMYQLLSVSPAGYWHNHYRLGKLSSRRNKSIGEETVNRILINTWAPISFVYGKETGIDHQNDRILHMLSSLPPEQNAIIRRWDKIIGPRENAAETQALLELYKEYCVPKKCLKCTIGHKILGRATFE
ncbi:MAG: DUF2851 family protein [Bacteroidia bacterium]|nr:MAG: DUF2851 family protein [Bacteroidia bacterium]